MMQIVVNLTDLDLTNCQAINNIVSFSKAEWIVQMNMFQLTVKF